MSPITRVPVLAWLLACLLGTLALPAHAETWRVDLIVFRFLSSAEETGQAPQAPSLRNAIELDDVSRLSAAGITLLPVETDFELGEAWTRLKSSPQFRPLIKLAWTQNDPPADNGPRIRLHGETQFIVKSPEGLGEGEFYEFDGTVGLHLGRFLHLDTDLIFTSAGEEAASWRLNESRRMRSDELHHLDSPRLGVVAVITKIVPTTN